MGSAHEAHTVPWELQAIWKIAREPARQRVRRLATASVSPNIRRAYGGALRRRRDWLTGRPLNDAILTEYLATRFEAGHSSPAANQVVGTGIESHVSGHSRRVTGAQVLAAAKASTFEMQSAGRWRSPSMPRRYAKGELSAHGTVTKLRYGM